MRLRLLFTQRRQGVLDEAAALKALCLSASLARLREFARAKCRAWIARAQMTDVFSLPIARTGAMTVSSRGIFKPSVCIHFHGRCGSRVCPIAACDFV
jgi:hypothetical protein